MNKVVLVEDEEYYVRVWEKVLANRTDVALQVLVKEMLCGEQLEALMKEGALFILDQELWSRAWTGNSIARFLTDRGHPREKILFSSHDSDVANCWLSIGKVFCENPDKNSSCKLQFRKIEAFLEGRVAFVFEESRIWGDHPVFLTPYKNVSFGDIETDGFGLVGKVSDNEFSKL